MHLCKTFIEIQVSWRERRDRVSIWGISDCDRSIKILKPIVMTATSWFPMCYSNSATSCSGYRWLPGSVAPYPCLRQQLSYRCHSVMFWGLPFFLPQLARVNFVGATKNLHHDAQVVWSQSFYCFLPQDGGKCKLYIWFRILEDNDFWKLLCWN